MRWLITIFLALSVAHGQGLFLMSETSRRLDAPAQTISLRLGYNCPLGPLTLTPSLFFRACLSGCGNAFYGFDLDIAQSADRGLTISLDSKGFWLRMWAVWRWPLAPEGKPPHG